MSSLPATPHERLLAHAAATLWPVLELEGMTLNVFKTLEAAISRLTSGDVDRLVAHADVRKKFLTQAGVLQAEAPAAHAAASQAPAPVQSPVPPGNDFLAAAATPIVVPPAAQATQKPPALCFVKPAVLAAARAAWTANELCPFPEGPWFFPNRQCAGPWAWRDGCRVHSGFQSPVKRCLLVSPTFAHVEVSSGTAVWHLAWSLPEGTVPNRFDLSTATRQQSVDCAVTDDLKAFAKVTAPVCLATGTADVMNKSYPDSLKTRVTDQLVEAFTPCEARGVVYARLDDLAGATPHHLFALRSKTDVNRAVIGLSTLFPHALVTRWGLIVLFGDEKMLPSEESLEKIGVVTRAKFQAEAQAAWIARKKASGAWQERPSTARAPRAPRAPQYPTVIEIARVDDQPFARGEQAALEKFLGQCKPLSCRNPALLRIAVPADTAAKLIDRVLADVWEFSLAIPRALLPTSNAPTSTASSTAAAAPV